MQRILVHSSNIRSVGYDSNAGVLEVEFDSGDVYQYFNVPDHIYRSLMASGSHGTFLNDYIRYNYRYQKVS